MSGVGGWLEYGVRWRSGEARPGRHAARQTGSGGALRGYRPFWQVPDARRIDVRRSIMDPGGELMVRQMENRGSIAVVVAADLSRSMQPRSGQPRSGPGKFDDVVALVQAASRTAHRSGDAFGFAGFDDDLRDPFSLRAGRARGPAIELLERLRCFRPAGRSVAGIAKLAAQVPERRALILLISDFRMGLDMLETALESLARHDVAPIVLHDVRELAFPAFGLVRLRDCETGRQTLLLMRAGLRERLAREEAAWRARLDAVFLRRCRPAFHAEGGLDLAALGQHLLHS